MSTPPPNFDDLVGADLEPRERDRLLRVHELLVAAGPPPELPSELDAAPRAATVHAFPRRRWVLAALAATLTVVVFAAGYLAGDRSDDPGTFATYAMSGVGATPAASGSLEIYDADAAGNWPMRLQVSGLGPAQSGRPYELWLTKGGELAAACGSFLADADGATVVPMNAPWRLRDFDAWVIVEQGSEAPLLTT